MSNNKGDKARELFALFDRENTGYITTESVARAMRLVGMSASPADVQKLVPNGRISYNQFQQLIAEQEANGSDEKGMLAAFQMMDKSGTGNLNKTDFKAAMTRFGENFSDAEVDEMFKEADVDGDGMINYEEFLKVMSPNPLQH
ncbi:hypothetical protein BZG36_00163 [Bifiguratus adelaidae]|uniref:EF-hand domain-containing protein n=1 Tax=Bifiguratus adelaidae TaxID=1938954 RepID=A0A261Y850_9FUNG|nr:hypothetical protein BZG36_00163 [Bifiguratus adelaidae]